MQVEIPDNCECEGQDFVCNRCIWNTACAIEDCREAFEKVAIEVDDNEEDNA